MDAHLESMAKQDARVLERIDRQVQALFDRVGQAAAPPRSPQPTGEPGPSRARLPDRHHAVAAGCALESLCAFDSVVF